MGELRMKWFAVALLIACTFFLGWACCRQYKADQGFVQGLDGQEWKLTRMQVLGMGQDYVAVYSKTQ